MNKFFLRNFFIKLIHPQKFAKGRGIEKWKGIGEREGGGLALHYKPTNSKNSDTNLTLYINIIIQHLKRLNKSCNN